MMAVLAGDIKKCRANDIRAFAADYMNEPRERSRAIPLGECLLSLLGETEIEDRVVRILGEPIHA